MPPRNGAGATNAQASAEQTTAPAAIAGRRANMRANAGSAMMSRRISGHA
jgi:hypothetical protein